MNTFKLDKRLIGNKFKPLIVVEIGINHEGKCEQKLMMPMKQVRMLNSNIIFPKRR